MPRDSGETIFAARHQSVSQGPLGRYGSRLSHAGMVPICPKHRPAQNVYVYWFFRSAPKGRQQMGETGFCKNLRFSAVSCENLRFPAVFCANLRLPNPLIYRASRKSAKICKNLRKCAFRVRFLPFAVSLLARPDFFLSD